jgi:5'(3')-deoxyribonucleotidase
MKSFEFESTNTKPPVVYVDMDGVLADFFGAAAEGEGSIHWRKARKEKDRIDQVAQEPGFFENLQPLPEAGKLIHGVLKYAGKYSILSSPLMSEVEQSVREKSEWLAKHLTKHAPKSILFDHNKEKFAQQADGTPNILIDDYATNIRLWEANGGIGILYKDGECDQALKKLRLALAGRIEPESVIDESVDWSEDPTTAKLYTNKQVLKYVKGVHVDGYTLDKPILDHKVWQLKHVPINTLKTPEFYDQDDRYRRVIDLDWDHIDDITTHDIKRKPVVVDDEGWVLDGNHRVTAARKRGMTSIKALVPYVKS